MRFLKLKRFWLGLIGLTVIALLASCTGTRTLMMTAPNAPKGLPASPPITATTLAEWKAQIPSLKTAFEREVYGTMPTSFETSLISARDITEHNFKADIKELLLAHQYGEDYYAVLVMPKSAKGPVPVIMMENFCPNHNVIPIEMLTKPVRSKFDCGGDGMMRKFFGYFFGRYITTPPVDMILERGYALAVIYPSDIYPDNATAFRTKRASAPSSEQPWGAVSAWAYQFSSLANYLGTEMPDAPLIAYGHSRYGKSALLAAAFNTTIDGVISHQSGTGGASLSKSKKGETVENITQGYPHWFAQGYSEDSLSVDQHQLLALIAPRPILLGNAKRDVWSDPEGAFKAARGASPAYQLYGSDGLRQSRLDDFDPQADLSFWIRPGTHGVTEEDWPAFLEFMDAHF